MKECVFVTIIVKKKRLHDLSKKYLKNQKEIIVTVCENWLISKFTKLTFKMTVGTDYQSIPSSLLNIKKKKKM